MRITGKQVVGLRIKNLRALKNITQQELAERCGLSPIQLLRIEQGVSVRNLSSDVFEKMAKAFNVDASYLDFDSVNTAVPSNEIYIIFEPDFQDMLKETIKGYKAQSIFKK